MSPRPSDELIANGVETGVHIEVDHGRTAVAYRIAKNVRRYKKIIGSLFADVWERGETISWIDVGAGYGEVVEAISELVAPGSRVGGIEPMKPKVADARARGLSVRHGYLSDVDEQFQFISLVNVFSHIPDFHDFLEQAKARLLPEGEMFIETGNIGDLGSNREVPTDLDLPDHLVFAGEQNMIDFLSRAGFSVVTIKSGRKDGFVNLAKNIARKMTGRNVTIALPYTSAYRTLFIRAKLAST